MDGHSEGGAICKRLGTGDSLGFVQRLSWDKHTADWTNASYTPAGFKELRSGNVLTVSVEFKDFPKTRFTSGFLNLH